MIYSDVFLLLGIKELRLKRNQVETGNWFYPSIPQRALDICKIKGAQGFQ